MWISRIALRNFKSYQSQVFDFPQPADGKNLVLIGGLNGYGKTTLLEAVYVGLYGEEAVNHKALDRACESQRLWPFSRNRVLQARFA